MALFLCHIPGIRICLTSTLDNSKNENHRNKIERPLDLSSSYLQYSFPNLFHQALPSHWTLHPPLCSYGSPLETWLNMRKTHRDWRETSIFLLHRFKWWLTGHELFVLELTHKTSRTTWCEVCKWSWFLCAKWPKHLAPLDAKYLSSTKCIICIWCTSWFLLYFFIISASQPGANASFLARVH